MNYEEIGNKARGLQLCASLGIAVPPWFAIPAETTRLRPWQEDAQFENNLFESARHLQTDALDALVVRSSSTLEDSDLSSHAGQFRTDKIDFLADLIPAIQSVAGSGLDSIGDSHSAAVIVQRYITGRFAGVAFSCRPTAGTPDEYYCEYVEGGCEQLVSGSISPGNLSIDIQLGKVDRAKNRDIPEVVLHLAETLADWIHKLETATDKLYDIEWVYDGVTLWCVQARPITSLQLDRKYLPAFCATSWFYDERFRTPLTPITRSTLMPLVFKAALQDPVEIAGGSASPDDVFYYAGRPYVPHQVYRQIFAGIPRFLMTPYLRQLFPPRCHCSGRQAPWSLSYVGRRLFNLLATAPSWLSNLGSWKRFNVDLHSELPSLRQLPSPDSSEWIEHWQLLQDWSEQFLAIHRWSILLADYANAAFHSCQALLPSRYASSLYGRLVAGLSLPTTEANRALVAFVHEDRTARAEFAEKYGHRSESLDFSHPRWVEQFQGIDLADKFPFFDRVQVPVPAPGRRRFRVPLLSKLVEMREQQRFEWERILALQRTMLLEMGARFTREGIFQSVDDIWFLHWDEVYDLSNGNLRLNRKDIDHRKHTHRVERKVRIPKMIPELHEDRQIAFGSSLVGTGASSGRAHGEVVVIQELDNLYAHARKRIILVMNNMCPADTPLLLGISGLVLETGGLLSHAAIMAREYGVPLVTSAPRATEVLQNGMIATIDGDTGLVEFGWRNDDER